MQVAPAANRRAQAPTQVCFQPAPSLYAPIAAFTAAQLVTWETFCSA